MLGIWSRKFYDSNDLEKVRLKMSGSRIMQFEKPEQSDVDEALLEWFKQERSENVPVSISLIMLTFC